MCETLCFLGDGGHILGYLAGNVLDFIGQRPALVRLLHAPIETLLGRIQLLIVNCSRTACCGALGDILGRKRDVISGYKSNSNSLSCGY